MQLLRAELHRRQALLEEGAGFRQVERQCGAVQFHQLVTEAQPAEAERRTDAGGNHEMQVVGAMVQQLLHELVGAWVHHMLVVVDDQEQFLVDAGGALDYGRHHLIDEFRPRALRGDAAVQRNAQALQRAAQVGEEDGEVLVVGTQRQPGHIRPGAHHFLPPLGQQRGLAETRAAGNQADPALRHAAQILEQAFAHYGLGANARWSEFRRYE
ncbi:hypothetical protein D3C72_1682240 [compost metagenome]